MSGLNPWQERELERNRKLEDKFDKLADVFWFCLVWCLCAAMIGLTVIATAWMVNVVAMCIASFI